MPRRRKMRLALASWETGRVQTGFGVKVGGLGAVMEELPEELVAAAARENTDLEIELLTPCFGHYDRDRLERLDLQPPVYLDGHEFSFDVFRFKVSKNLSLIYFWDSVELSWTNAGAIYPDDPEMGFKLFAVVSQAMAGYLVRNRFDVVHSHDYHVGLIPFYLGDAYLASVRHHFTIHNASYQGIYSVLGHGYEMLERIGLPGELLFHKYFDFFDNLNLMKAAMIKTHETGGKVTTVSGDIAGTWGYAAELRKSREEVEEEARKLKPWSPVGRVFVPNRHLDVFEHIPIVGITNGLSEKNWPQNLAELQAAKLQEVQERLPRGVMIFRHPEVQQEMLGRDHTFDAEHLEVKQQLKRLLHLEVFGSEPEDDLVFLTIVGRLVEQKNLRLAGDIAERALHYDRGVKFVILASAPQGDREGKLTEGRFRRLASLYPDRFSFATAFNLPLSKLIFAGGDFTLIPSRFEPCGLVDYEASLLGNVVIAHRTGGLAKIECCGYLYEWLDEADHEGEAIAFFDRIREALDTYRHDPERHRELVRRAMAIDAHWSKSASQYLAVYRYGLLLDEWAKKRESLLKNVDGYADKLVRQEPLTRSLFFPFRADLLDRRLADALKGAAEPAVGEKTRPPKAASRRKPSPTPKKGGSGA